MDFISVEEFNKQSEKVKNIFKEFFDHEEMLFEDGSIYFGTFKDEDKYTPLLTEGQLRQFIEDKSKCKNVEISGDIETGQYYADFYEEIYSGIEINTIENLGTDKFKAYWTLALIFAKEEI